MSAPIRAGAARGRLAAVGVPAALVLALLTSPTPAGAAEVCPQPGLTVVKSPQSTRTTSLAAGVSVRQYWGKPQGKDQMQATVVTADLRKVRPAAVTPPYAGQVAATGRLAGTAGVLAAVNGDYFVMNTTHKALPSGVLVSGSVRFAPADPGQYVGVDDTGAVRTGRAQLSGAVRVLERPGGRLLSTIPVTAVNAKPVLDGVAVYTPALDPANSRRGDWQVLVRRGAVAASGSSLSVDLTTLPAADGAVVLVGRGRAVTALKALKAGTAVTWSASVVDVAGGRRIVSAIGAGPKVLAGGEVSGPCTRSYRSRTMVAWSGDGTRMWLVTLNSNQPSHWTPAAGATYRQLGMLARDLGASTAVLLDGGGSTTLVARTGGRMARLDADPSRTQRSVADAWGLLPR